MKSKPVSSVFDIDRPPPLTAGERRQLETTKPADDADIDLSDIPETDFSGATRFRDRHLYRPLKRSTTVRIDADVLLWLKAQGRGYQTRLNAILRDAMAKDEKAANG